MKMEKEQFRSSERISCTEFLDVKEAITSRRSVRSFLDKPVPMDAVREILETGARAPSGTNMQPWNAWVVSGAARDRLVQTVLARPDARVPGTYVSPHVFYPGDMPEPYRTRRRTLGWTLYGLLGIEKGDRDKSWVQHERNYQFFGAPVGIILTIRNELKIGSWLDYGMLVQNICLMARRQGLHTCVQAAWAQVNGIVKDALDIPENHTVVCGVSLGYADPSAPENELRSTRVDLSEWATFLDD